MDVGWYGWDDMERGVENIDGVADVDGSGTGVCGWVWEIWI